MYSMIDTQGKVLVFDRLEDAIRGVQLVSEAIVDDFIIKRILFEGFIRI